MNALSVREVGGKLWMIVRVSELPTEDQKPDRQRKSVKRKGEVLSLIHSFLNDEKRS